MLVMYLLRLALRSGAMKKQHKQCFSESKYFFLFKVASLTTGKPSSLYFSCVSCDTHTCILCSKCTYLVIPTVQACSLKHSLLAQFR